MEDFHQTAKKWAEIKHALLAKYLRLFVGKTGKGRSRVYYVDAFAGPGRLEDDTKGSPLYAAEAAADPLHRTREGVLRCINIESDPETFKKLESATAQHVSAGHVINMMGRFEDRRDEVLRLIANDPAIFFIDPFGTQGAELSSLKVLKRPGAIREVLVRYDDTRVKRLASWAANNLGSHDTAAQKTAEAFLRRATELTSVNAAEDFLTGNPNARERLINGYIGEARRMGIFKFGIAYPLRNPDTAGHRYFLVHLCDFEDGYIWMANFMASAEITYEELRQERDMFQPEFFSVRDLTPHSREVVVSKVESALAVLCRERNWPNGKCMQIRKVLAGLVDKFQWHASRADYEEALRRLRANGLLSCKTFKDSDTITLNLLR